MTRENDVVDVESQWEFLLGDFPSSLRPLLGFQIPGCRCTGNMSNNGMEQVRRPDAGEPQNEAGTRTRRTNDGDFAATSVTVVF